MKKIIFFILILIIPILAFANGGDQRIVEGKYYINLSRSPFTPRAGDRVSMIASFVDLKTDKLVAEDLIVKVRISKMGEAPKGNFLFVQDKIRVEGGVLELPYTFAEPGLQEIFFDFAFASNPEKVYNAPDFLIDIQKPETQPQTNHQTALWIILGVAFGFIGGWLLKSRFRAGS